MCIGCLKAFAIGHIFHGHLQFVGQVAQLLGHALDRIFQIRNLRHHGHHFLVVGHSIGLMQMLFEQGKRAAQIGGGGQHGLNALGREGQVVHQVFVGGTRAKLKVNIQELFAQEHQLAF